MHVDERTIALVALPPGLVHHRLTARNGLQRKTKEGSNTRPKTVIVLPPHVLAPKGQKKLAEGGLVALRLRGQVRLGDVDSVEAERDSRRQLDGGDGVRTHGLGIPHAELWSLLHFAGDEGGGTIIGSRGVERFIQHCVVFRLQSPLGVASMLSDAARVVRQAIHVVVHRERDGMCFMMSTVPSWQGDRLLLLETLH